jgi:hypothetical protein
MKARTMLMLLMADVLTRAGPAQELHTDILS